MILNKNDKRSEKGNERTNSSFSNHSRKLSRTASQKSFGDPVLHPNLGASFTSSRIEPDEDKEAEELKQAMELLQSKSSLKRKFKNSMMKKSFGESPVMSVIQEESEQKGSPNSTIKKHRGLQFSRNKANVGPIAPFILPMVKESNSPVHVRKRPMNRVNS